jgi:hypothetical protein
MLDPVFTYGTLTLIVLMGVIIAWDWITRGGDDES